MLCAWCASVHLVGEILERVVVAFRRALAGLLPTVAVGVFDVFLPEGIPPKEASGLLSRDRPGTPFRIKGVPAL